MTEYKVMFGLEFGLEELSLPSERSWQQAHSWFFVFEELSLPSEQSWQTSFSIKARTTQNSLC